MALTITKNKKTVLVQDGVKQPTGISAARFGYMVNGDRTLVTCLNGTEVTTSTVKTTDVTVNGTAATPSTVEGLLSDLIEAGGSGGGGDISESPVTFEEVDDLTPITSGSKLSEILGIVAAWFTQVISQFSISEESGNMLVHILEADITDIENEKSLTNVSAVNSILDDRLSSKTIVVMTEAEYQALTEYDDNILYFTTEA